MGRDTRVQIVKKIRRYDDSAIVVGILILSEGGLIDGFTESVCERERRG